jgi:hypothetical protein
MVVETFDALVSERGDTGKIWASLLKDTLKRRRPDFSETYYGFRTFGNLLEEAQTRGLFEFGRDEKSGTYVFRGANAQVELQAVEPVAEPAVSEDIEPQQAVAEPVTDAIDELGAETQGEQPPEAPASGRESRRRGGRNRKGRDAQAPAPVQEVAQEAAPASEDAALATWPAPTPDLAEAPEPAASAAGEAEAPAPAIDTPAPAKERRRSTRKTPSRKTAAAAAEAPPVADTGTAVTPESAATDDGAVALDAQTAVADDADLAATPSDTVAAEGEGEGQNKSARKKSGRPSHKAPSRKPAARAPRRPAKPKTPPENG